MDIQLRGISKSFGSVQANQDINLDIDGAEKIGIVGRTGVY